MFVSSLLSPQSQRARLLSLVELIDVCFICVSLGQRLQHLLIFHCSTLSIVRSPRSRMLLFWCLARRLRTCGGGRRCFTVADGRRQFLFFFRRAPEHVNVVNRTFAMETVGH